MRWLRIAYRVPAAMAATALFAAIPAAVRLLAPGRRSFHAKVGATACRAWGRTLCAILSIRRVVEGRLPSEGVFLVAANHLSYVDILVLGSLYPSVFLAKREIASWPVFGWIARGAGTLFVDREQGKDVV
ncbi:MAG TPA: lysophospholipid acyltransferase family protein, partial [Candidatus Polarisedimenticolaceae bacterium]|nr:lysophospholipid acyltransferase family protein [Candidatus Polarisedimenticolaceae bacterium]